MLVTRTKYIFLLIFFALWSKWTFAGDYRQGLWIGYSHGFISPVIPAFKPTVDDGHWSEIGIGYDRVLSPHFLAVAGYRRAALYDFRNDKNKFPISFMHGLELGVNYYPVAAFKTDNDRNWSAMPFVSVGLNATYWSIDAIDKYEQWEGVYLLPQISAGAMFRLGAYTMLHASLGVRTTAMGKIDDVQGFNAQVRVSYDLHIKKQRELENSYRQNLSMVDSLAERADSMSKELQSEGEKIRYAMDEYEQLLLDLAGDVDSIKAEYKKLNRAMKDSVAQLSASRRELTRVQTVYDSIRKHSWDSLQVISANDSLHDIHDPKYLMSGSYLILYTGDQHEILSNIYQEVSAEYQKSWLIQNYFGMQRVMIWLPENQVDAEWKKLSASFSDLKKFEP